MAHTPVTQAWVEDDLNARLVRYGDLIPCTTAFVDARTPGSDRKENFTIIGPGVAENPDQHVHIQAPHGFNVGGARQPPHCVNSQHSHETAEVFVVHQGQWAFYAGENGEDAEVVLTEGDVISIPTQVFRGFENVGNEVGFLFAVLGGDDPGRVTWAPYVFEAAKQHGLVLLQNGGLVDLTQGQAVPEDAAPQAPTTAEQAAQLERLDGAALDGCVARSATLEPARRSLVRAEGVLEHPIIGSERREGLPAGPLNWRHGFQLRKLIIEPGAASPAHARPQEEVLLMHRGDLSVTVGPDQVKLTSGDVLSIPVGVARRYCNVGSRPCELYAVDGGDTPSGRRVAMSASTETP